MSSLSPDLGKKLFEHHQKYGAHFVAAPVFGPPTFAATRKLFICVAGNAQARERVAPILKELGQKTFDLGDNPPSSMIMKLMGNFLMLSASQSMAEVLA